jgi:hypothetical protein
VIKFQVQAHSATCKCVVTASVGTDAKVRMIAVHKCAGHDELEKKLADQARTALKKKPCGFRSCFAVLRVLGTYESTFEGEEETIG